MEIDRREMSNVIKYYRNLKGLTQPELVKEMKGEFPWVDASLISKMESEKCEPTEAMRAWACNMANSFIQSRNTLKGIVNHSEDKVSENGDFSPLMAKVYEALKDTDIDHRLTRYQLGKLTGMGDRRNRDLLEEMRSMGYRIGSEMGAEGYWLIRSEEEYRAWIKVYSSRAYTVLRNKSAMDNYVEGQIRI